MPSFPVTRAPPHPSLHHECTRHAPTQHYCPPCCFSASAAFASFISAAPSSSTPTSAGRDCDCTTAPSIHPALHGPSTFLVQAHLSTFLPCKARHSIATLHDRSLDCTMHSNDALSALPLLAWTTTHHGSVCCFHHLRPSYVIHFSRETRNGPLSMDRHLAKPFHCLPPLATPLL
jgi:hypothetical protein